MTAMREGPDLPDLGGTAADPEVMVGPSSPSSESQPPVVLVGRLVSVRFVFAPSAVVARSG